MSIKVYPMGAASAERMEMRGLTAHLSHAVDMDGGFQEGVALCGVATQSLCIDDSLCEPEPDCPKCKAKMSKRTAFTNETEPAERLQAALDRAERAESNAADLAAELQWARIVLQDIYATLCNDAWNRKSVEGQRLLCALRDALAKVQPMKTKGNQ